MKTGRFLAVFVGALLVVAVQCWVLHQKAYGQPGQRRAFRGPQLNPLLRLFDADRNGELSAEEIAAASERLKKLDNNGDGKLAGDELRRLLPALPGAQPAQATTTEYENPQLPKDEQEAQALKVLEQMAQNRRGFASVPPEDGRLLRLLAEAVGAKRIVEIGTSQGYSTICFALAVRKTGGHIYTHEIDPDRARIAEQNFKRAGVADYITVIVGDAHETVKQHKEPVDVVFIDADKSGYLDYLQKMLPLVRPGGLIIAHNMRFPTPDPKFIEAITKDPNLETCFLHMDGPGLAVVLKKR